MDAPNGLSAKEYYGYISGHIDKEIDLVNNRLSWMLSFQGFLFASISIVTSKESEVTLRTFLRDAFSFAGIAVAVLTLIGVCASALHRDSLKRQWTKLEYQDFPPLSSKPLISTMGRITSFGIPVTIIIVWIAVWCGIK